MAKYNPYKYPNRRPKTKNLGFIQSLFSFIYIPCILTLLIIAFGKTFANMGLSNFLLALFWSVSLIILIAYKYQELENIRIQFKKGNWF